ncbi:unnamed protein product [Durusdinium trenchii]|uniref:Uncharacterized protein n=2 Tax=Durusdinium trenchii TaxID=1381693 RepID=A0ABP0Q9T1_9DINO
MAYSWLLLLLTHSGLALESCDDGLEDALLSMLQTTVTLDRTKRDLTLKDQVYNVHIPKSAGSSFALDAQEILRPLHLISQEGCLSLHQSNPQLKGAITMLRDPRAHVLSQYKMCRSQWVSEFRTAVRQKGDWVLPHRFENWVDAWERLREESWHGDFTPSNELSGATMELKIRESRVKAWGEPPYSVDRGTRLRMEDWPQLDGGGTVWHFTKVPFQCYSPMNLQSHRLTCSNPMKYDAQIDKELLIQNVNTLWFVGFAEAYQSSLCLLHWRVNQTLPSYCDCMDKQSWQSFQGHTENQNSTYHGEAKLSQLSRKVLKEIDALTATDRFLYDFAWRRFVRDCDMVFQQSGKQILCNVTGPPAPSL